MKTVLSLLAIPYLLHADFNAQHWQFQRAIQVKTPAALSTFVADESLYRSSLAKLSDIRIIRDGLEISYQIKALSGQQSDVELEPKLLNKSIVRGVGLQATLDVSGHSQHNRLKIITTLQNFKETVRVETSDDNRRWALVQEESVIFDISKQDQHVSSLFVEYPTSTRRYVRITIPGWKNPDYLQSALLILHTETRAVRDQAVILNPVVDEDAKMQVTSLLLDLGYNGRPYDCLELSVRSGSFFRHVEVLGSNDGKGWLTVGSGVVLRTAERSQLSIDIPEQWNRYAKIIISNGDNPALPIQSVSAKGIRRVFLFPSTLAGSYWLYAGNAEAKTPSYDFEQITHDKPAATSVLLGETEKNHNYQTPQLPWSDQHSSLLIGALIITVIIMGYITIQAFMKIRSS